MLIKKLLIIISRDGFIFTLKRITAWLLGRSPFAHKLSFSYYKNVRLVFAPSMLTYILFASKKERQNDVAVIERYVKSGYTVIDVGAHIGSMAVVAASIVGQNGRILAFEPVPKFFNILNANVKKNKLEKIIKTYPYAVGAQPDEVFIDDKVSDDTTNHIASSGTKVSQITLDEYTRDLPTINFLKIDVEGYELEVLRGAVATLTKTKTIFIEFYTRNLIQLGYHPAEVIKLLQAHFTLYTQNSEMTELFVYTTSQEYEINLVGVQK